MEILEVPQRKRDLRTLRRNLRFKCRGCGAGGVLEMPERFDLDVLHVVPAGECDACGGRYALLVSHSLGEPEVHAIAYVPGEALPEMFPDDFFKGVLKALAHLPRGYLCRGAEAPLDPAESPPNVYVGAGGGDLLVVYYMPRTPRSPRRLPGPSVDLEGPDCGWFYANTSAETSRGEAAWEGIQYALEQICDWRNTYAPAADDP